MNPPLSSSKIRIYFGLILILMIGATSWASLEKNVWLGLFDLLSTRWGIATLADAYCGFMTFYAWLFYKESSAASRLVWLVLILLTGNIAMSIYVLRQVMNLGTSFTVEGLLLRADHRLLTGRVVGGRSA